MKHVLCAFLLSALPAFGTISQRQVPVSQWNSTLKSSCFASLGTSYTAGDLIVVWTYWSTGSSPNNITASASDPLNGTYASAVGPTLQPAASNTAAQIFYFKNTVTGSGPLQVTVNYSGSVNPSGCVFVEYEGADTLAPLDSVSEAISNSGSTSNLWDSGTVAPANANLLLFGAGTSDSGTAFPGSGFSNIQNNGGSVTEYQVVSGNSSLQRATAGTGITNGNWIMQMAVFRAATWTISNGWGTTRANNVRYADQFPGADCGAKINAADADLAINAGEIWVSQLCGTTITTAVTLNTNHTLRFSQGGNYIYSAAFTLNNGTAIVTSPQSIDYDPMTFGDPPVVLVEATGASLPCSFQVEGLSVTFENIAIKGNSANSTGNVGICTVPSVPPVTNNRGFGKIRHATIEYFSGDCVDITSSDNGSGTFYDEAVGWVIEDSTMTRCGGGTGGGWALQETESTDLKITDSFFALSTGCIRVFDSNFTMHGGDVSSCNSGIYEIGSGHYANSPSQMYIEGTSFTVPTIQSGSNPSLNGAIVVQGWDGTYCGGANANHFVNLNFQSPQGMTENNAFDMIHIENSNANVISSNGFFGAASCPVINPHCVRYAYDHEMNHGCTQTAGGDTLNNNTFTGVFSSGLSLQLHWTFSLATMKAAMLQPFCKLDWLTIFSPIISR